MHHFKEERVTLECGWGMDGAKEEKNHEETEAQNISLLVCHFIESTPSARQEIFFLYKLEWHWTACRLLMLTVVVII